MKPARTIQLAVREWRRQPWFAGASTMTVLAGTVPYPHASRLVTIDTRPFGVTR